MIKKSRGYDTVMANPDFSGVTIHKKNGLIIEIPKEELDRHGIIKIDAYESLKKIKDGVTKEDVEKLKEFGINITTGGQDYDSKN
jgi:hypothetical protein